MTTEKIIKKARNVALLLLARVAGYAILIVVMGCFVVPSLIDLHDDMAAWIAIAAGLLTIGLIPWSVADIAITISKIDKKDQS